MPRNDVMLEPTIDMVDLATLNSSDQSSFVAAIGFVFEHTPWIAAQTWWQRPFTSVDALHEALCATLASATATQQLALIRAHPDLVGRAAQAGTLGASSQHEQTAAGLNDLDAEDVAQFTRYNAAYQERFGFPFVICARENKKDAILAAFPVRLQHSRDAEIATALDEITKIVWLRLRDTVCDERE